MQTGTRDKSLKKVENKIKQKTDRNNDVNDAEDKPVVIMCMTNVPESKLKAIEKKLRNIFSLLEAKICVKEM